CGSEWSGRSQRGCHDLDLRGAERVDFIGIEGSVRDGARRIFLSAYREGPPYFPNSLDQYSPVGIMVVFVCLERTLQRFVQCCDLSQLDSVRNDRCRGDRFATKESGFAPPLSDLGISLGSVSIRGSNDPTALPNSHLCTARIRNR